MKPPSIYCTGAMNPMKTVTVEALSAELFQSRTSLFKGSKEHFQQTPVELQRSVRMDCVRQLLLDPRRRTNQGLTGVGDTATSMGFTAAATLLGAIKSNTENTRRTHSPTASRARLKPGAIHARQRLHLQEGCRKPRET